jgi:hypothetical protein
MKLLFTSTPVARRAAAAAALLVALVACAAIGAGAAAASPGSPSTTTTLVVSPAAVAPGDTVTMTAVVNGTGGNPTGSVVFASGATIVGSATLTPTAGSTTQSSATLTSISFAAGNYVLTATYLSDDLDNYNGSTSPGAPLAVSSLALHNTTTTLTGTPTSVIAGQAVLLTAHVAESDGGTIIPTGAVTFTEGGVLLGTATLDATGTAQLSVPSFLSGTHLITVSYIGDIVDRSSSATLTLVVSPGGGAAVQTTTTVQVTPNRILTGQTVTVSAHVVQTGTATTPPAGAVVTFTADGNFIGQAVLDANGNATVTVPSWVTGTYNIQASYVGDINDRASSGDVQLSVNAAPTPLVVTSPGATFAYGGTVPTLTPVYSGFTGGDNSTSLTSPATCTTTATAASAPGTYPVSCSGAASSVYTISYVNTGSVTVTRAPLTVTAPSVSITAGQAIPALTATITGFKNGQTLATSGVTGSASCTTTATASSPAGTYPITCTQGTLASANYSFGTFTAGTLMIAPAANTSCTTARNIGDWGAHRPSPCEVLLYAFTSGGNDCSNSSNGVQAGDTLSSLYSDETPLASGALAPTATVNGQAVTVTVTPILGRYIALLTFKLPSTLAPGTYTIKLTAHDSDGDSDLVTWPVTVTRSSGSHDDDSSSHHGDSGSHH